MLVVTGIIHDYEHPGLNNPFLAKTKDILSIRYNGNVDDKYSVVK